MKSLIKIYSKYIGTAWIISILFLVINGAIFLGFSIKRFANDMESGYLGIHRISELADIAIDRDTDGNLLITEDAIRYMQERNCCFLLILNNDGDVIADWQKPEEIKDHYTSGEIAAFSKWYLHDYPVGVWRMEDGLMVLGYPKDSIWKYNVEFSMDFSKDFLLYFEILLAGNVFLILVMVVFFGFRYYRSLQPMVEGLELLSANKRVYLSEKGAVSELSAKINKTSAILEEQRQTISARDTARTEWIAGISHDIRTPLSMIMGYADDLESDKHLTEEEQRKAELIKKQSLKIKQLIEDLNLTSKLAYQMQPLRKESFSPAPLLRSLAAEKINEGLDEKYRLIPKLDSSIEEITLYADKGLLIRAVGNLLNNSMEHNPNGCHIYLAAKSEDRALTLSVMDDGCGIPEEICRLLDTEENDYSKKKPHIMGLRIVKQIALAHNGDFRIMKNGHLVEIHLPLGS